MLITMSNEIGAFREHQFAYAPGNEKQEEATFTTYFNLALSNVEGMMFGEVESNPYKIEKSLDTLPPAILRQIASFIWLSKEEHPNKAYSTEEVKVIVTDLVRRLCFYRNYFSHCFYLDTQYFYSDELVDTTAIGEKLPYNFHHFITNRLFRYSLPEITLFRWNEGERKYEILRGGLIFFCCLFLKRGQAERFLNELRFFKRTDEEGRIKRTIFTKYCTRESHKHIGIEEQDFLIFQDIIGDLNRVPKACDGVVDLSEENERYIKNRETSNESDENKARYRLLIREKDKFPYYLMRYIVDFGVLPCITFKQNDYSTKEGRGQFHYQDAAVAQEERCYNFVVRNGNVYYSYMPQAQNVVRISELQGTISVEELRNMVYASINGKDVNKSVEQYLYHLHLLYEKILTISGQTIKEGRVDVEDYRPLLDKLLLRPASNGEELRRELRKLLPKRVCDLLSNRFDCSEGVSAVEKRLKAILLRHEQLLLSQNPALHIDKIKSVIDYLYLFFSDDEKFRQLPTEKAHRGLKDEEFQMYHYLVGDYDSHPLALWKELEASGRLKPEMRKLISATSLHGLYMLCLKGTVEWCRKQLMSIGKGTAKVEAIADRVGLKLYDKLKEYTPEQLEREVKLVVMHGYAAAATPKPKAQAAIPSKLTELRFYSFLGKREMSFAAFIRQDKKAQKLWLRNFYTVENIKTLQKRQTAADAACKKLYNLVGEVERVHTNDKVLVLVAQRYRERLLNVGSKCAVTLDNPERQQKLADVYEVQNAWLSIRFDDLDFTLTHVNLSNLRKAYNLIPRKHILAFKEYLDNRVKQKLCEECRNVRRKEDLCTCCSPRYSNLTSWLKENHSESSIEREAATMMLLDVERTLLSFLPDERRKAIIEHGKYIPFSALVKECRLADAGLCGIRNDVLHDNVISYADAIGKLSAYFPKEASEAVEYIRRTKEVREQRREELMANSSQ